MIEVSPVAQSTIQQRDLAAAGDIFARGVGGVFERAGQFSGQHLGHVRREEGHDVEAVDLGRGFDAFVRVLTEPHGQLQIAARRLRLAQVDVADVDNLPGHVDLEGIHIHHRILGVNDATALAEVFEIFADHGRADVELFPADVLRPQRQFDGHVRALDPSADELRGHEEGIPRLRRDHRVQRLQLVVRIDYPELRAVDVDARHAPFAAEDAPRIEPSAGPRGVERSDGLTRPAFAREVFCHHADVRLQLERTELPLHLERMRDRLRKHPVESGPGDPIGEKSGQIMPGGKCARAGEQDQREEKDEKFSEHDVQATAGEALPQPRRCFCAGARGVHSAVVPSMKTSIC